MDQATTTTLAKMTEVDEETESAKDKRKSLNKTNQILQEYLSALEKSLRIVMARNTEMDVELEATLREIAMLKQKNPRCIFPGPIKEDDGGEIYIFHQ